MLTGCFFGCIIFRFQKNKNPCLLMTNHAKLKNVPLFFELVRISKHALQGMIEASSKKNWSKLFQPSEIDQVAWWGKTSKNFVWEAFQRVISLVEYIFFDVKMLLDSFQLLFKFNRSLDLQIVCISKDFRRQVCFSINFCLVSVTNSTIVVFYLDYLAYLLDCLVCHATVAGKNFDSECKFWLKKYIQKCNLSHVLKLLMMSKI